MASDSPWTRLKEEATCTICWEYYVNPSILDCGHSFCAVCLSECWKEFPDAAACPQCRTAVERKNCRPNTQLANVVEIAKQLSSLVKGEVRKVCEKHPEPVGTTFCVTDQIIFCYECDGHEQHRGHHLTSVKETAQLYKCWYSSYIESLKMARSEMVKNKFQILQWGDNLQQNAAPEHQTIATAFYQLHDFLTNQEGYLQMRFQSVVSDIADKRNRDLARLCLDIFTLENKIRQLEEKASQPVHEFLQGAMTIYEKCHSRAVSLALDDISLDLKWGYCELLETSATVKGLVNSFIDTLQNAFSSMRATVTLDEKSSNPHLLLSPDCKSVNWEPVAEQQHYWVGRFTRISAVVGCQKFTVGRHFWEVVVEGPGDWAVGVARSSVKRKGHFSDTLCVKEGVFAVGKLEQQYSVFNAPHSVSLPQDGELKRIGVSLNCYAEELNFYNMARAVRIFGFTEIGCLQEPFLPFFWLEGRVQLTII